ncbi:MAG: efflux RND transporter periplasmic adaptor subunit [Dehalococcoidia bacterium]|nr:efflux RND transporter periplasmic adaptor subunit [Dehalococcoidia bacterium]
MGTLLNALKTLKLWQVGVLAAVLVGVAGATYGVYAMSGSSGSSDLSKNQQLIPVVYGNVVNQVSTNGSLAFTNRATLTFGTAGIVAEIPVTDGQQVKEGQTLATLDTATVASLQKAVAQARVNLQNAQAALAMAKAPGTLVMAQAEAKVANAKLALQTAQDNLDTVKAGPTADDLAKAQAKIDSAKASLAYDQQNLKLAQKTRDTNVKTAVDLLATAKASYQAVFPKWLGFQIGQGQVDLTPDTILASWKVDLNALFNPSLRFQDFSKGWFAGGIASDDPSTPWDESIIYTWLNLYPGQLLATCPSGDVPSQGTCVKKNMDDAWTAYQNAKDNLDAVQTQATKAVVNAQTAITLDNDAITIAETALTNLTTGADPLQVDASAKQLAVSQASLAQAQADLANLKVSIPLDIANKEADVATTQATLDTAVQRLAGSTLKATMSGMVALGSVVAGQTVGANTAIMDVVDTSTIELDGIVDQTDVLFVKVGAQAAVTTDALPGRVLQGTVSAIASTAQTLSGVVSYPISITLQVPQGLDLRAGLTATASIVIRQQNNVLRVPLQAVYGTVAQPSVKVSKGGVIVDQPIVLGNSDDYWVAVLQGLAQGDQVVMQSAATTAGQINAGQVFRQMQGQFGGGAAFGGGNDRGQGQGGGNNTPRTQTTPRAQTTPRPQATPRPGG